MEKIWEQQNKESDSDYSLFLKYLAFDSRNIIQFGIANSIAPKKIKSTSHLHNWESRAAAYDTYFAKLYEDKKAKTLIDLAENDAHEIAQINKITISTIKEEMFKYLFSAKDSKDIKISIRDLERLKNMISEISQSNNEVDLAEISDEDLKSIASILGKTK